jgi:hypothetical protein
MYIKENIGLIRKMQQGFGFVQENEVLIGVPQEANTVHSGGVTMAELMYIHSEGSPARHIPARPTIQIALAKPEVRKMCAEELNQGIDAGFNGLIGVAQTKYERAGMIGANAAKAVFGSGALAPLKPSTIARRKKHSAAPLVDTGALRNSVTYVVRRKKGGGLF